MSQDHMEPNDGSISDREVAKELLYGATVIIAFIIGLLLGWVYESFSWIFFGFLGGLIFATMYCLIGLGLCPFLNAILNWGFQSTKSFNPVEKAWMAIGWPIVLVIFVPIAFVSGILNRAFDKHL